MAINYSGPSHVTNISNDRKDFDIDDIITELEPEESEFTTLTMKARKKSTDTEEFKWFEQEQDYGWTQFAAAADAAATSLVVDDASLFAPKDILKVPRTGEVMFVTESDNSTTIKVNRGYSGTAAAVVVDDYMFRLGNAMEDNSSAPNSKLRQPSPIFNFVQTLRTPFDGSDITEVEAVKAGPKERQRLRLLKMFEHKLDIERIMLWGERKNDITNKRRTTGGVFSFVTTNVVNAGGELSEAEFNNFLRVGYEHGSKSKILICSYFVAGIINQFAASQIQTSSGDDTYGLKLKEYLNFYGRTFIVPSKTFTKYYAGHALLLDMKNILYRPLEGRDTKFRANIQANDTDGWKDEYITKFGVQVKQEKTHAILYGVTS